jgi:hypothetical protein
MALRVAALLLLTGLGFLVMGYHPGAEDDGIYVTAVKSDLNSSLFPHDGVSSRNRINRTLNPWPVLFSQKCRFSISIQVPECTNV